MKIEPAFRDLIPPLTDEERKGLEESIIAHGCRDPITVWKNHDILLDGHNRYEICERNGIAYPTFELSFATESEAKSWMIRNQFGRRNLTDATRIKLALALKEQMAEQARQNKGGRPRKGEKKKPDQNSDQVFREPQTLEKLAELAGVSRDTLHKGEKVFASGNAEVIQQYERGELSTDKALRMVKQSAIPDKPAIKPPKPKGLNIEETKSRIETAIGPYDTAPQELRTSLARFLEFHAGRLKNVYE